MIEKEIIEILDKDPEQGIKILLKQYTPLVATIIRNKLLIPPFCQFDIENCISDVFSEFYLNRRYYQKNIQVNLCLLAKRRSIDLLRKYYKDKEMIAFDENQMIEIVDNNINEYKQKLLIEINQLKEPEKEIFIRKYYLEESSKEISTFLSHMKMMKFSILFLIWLNIIKMYIYHLMRYLKQRISIIQHMEKLDIFVKKS